MYAPIFSRHFMPVRTISDSEKSSIRRNGLIGKIQRRVHADLKDSGLTFTLGTINFPSEVKQGVTEDTAPEIEAILKRARADITAVLARGMGI